MGRMGFVVWNASQSEPIYDLELEPMDADGAAILRFIGNNPTRVEGPLRVPVVPPNGKSPMWQLMGADATRDVADQVTITFDNAFRRFWQRIGNQEPKTIERQHSQ
jgi:hypothetical protein